MIREAVLASQATICVAQFMKEPNHETKLKELGEVGSWQRELKLFEKGAGTRCPGKKRLAGL